MIIVSTVSISPFSKASNSCFLCPRVRSLCRGTCTSRAISAGTGDSILWSLTGFHWPETFSHEKDQSPACMPVHGAEPSLLVLRVLGGQRSLPVHQTTSIAPLWNYHWTTAFDWRFVTMCEQVLTRHNAKPFYQVHTCVIMCCISLTVNHTSLLPTYLPLWEWLEGIGRNMQRSKQDCQVRACKASISRSSDGLLPSPWHMLSHLSIQENLQTTIW